MSLTPAICDEHYAHLKDKPFFPKLVKFMTSGPIVAGVLEGVDCVNVVRAMCGATNSRNAAPGTIRGDFGLSTQYNIIHASDSLETAEKEIARFFKKDELHSYKRVLDSLTAAEDEKA